MLSRLTKTNDGQHDTCAFERAGTFDNMRLVLKPWNILPTRLAARRWPVANAGHYLAAEMTEHVAARTEAEGT
jgi:hypothetical protein